MYAWTRISDLDLLMVSMIASEQPPFGLKKTRTGVSLGRMRSAASRDWAKRREIDKTNTTHDLNVACFFNSPISAPHDQIKEVGDILRNRPNGLLCCLTHRAYMS